MSNHPVLDASHVVGRSEETQDTVDQQRREEGWIARCLAGDAGAFEGLIASHETMVRSMIRRLVDAEHEVDELAQQTFIAAYENLRQYAGTARFSTWLCQIALNKSRDHMRRWRARRDDADIDELDLASDARGPDGLLAAKQLDRQLQAALRAMKRADREVIVFKYIAGHSYETVAQILGCTPQAAKVRSVRARDELKKVLESMGIEP